eukprot:CAMPEP_0172670500 /NCGR_PEP_ID=MMETSP1074-20121228/10338_1 /TAXON_ID=2916 /ORGANISM="Ceratium fusus, Strain PA161109" /LENGTH=546 /DNA_ID=CAMNT_0013487425 /DNA_START=128 /DNA_END=1768 /DNA_ORIENTATION=+
MEAPRPELDMMVLEFTSRDDSNFVGMGRHLKEMRWKVAAMGTPPLEVKLNVEKQPLMEPDVGVFCNGTKIFPLGSGERAKMKDDFEHSWPFRAEVKNLTKKNFFEVRPRTMGNNWFPANSIVQMKDGLFEASVWFPDGAGGAKEVVLPNVDKSDIREAASKQALDIPYRNVVLNIPSSDPLHETTLMLADDAGEEPITYSFAKPTPPASRAGVESIPSMRPVGMTVSKDRSLVTSDITHSMLTSYLTAEPTMVECTSSTTQIMWKLMIGPFAEHHIVLEKKLASQGIQQISNAAGVLTGGLKQAKDVAEIAVLQQSHLLSLTVDGRVLVESAAEDFDVDWESGSSPTVDSETAWLCKFRFLGENSVLFKVFETNGSGITLDSTDLVEGLRKDQIKVCKACTVCAEDIADLSTATLDIDGVLFGSLKPYSPPDIGGAPIACDPQVLGMQYGITVPHKVRDVAPMALIQERLQAGGAALSSMVQEHWEKSQPGIQAFQGRLHENWAKSQPGLQSIQGKLQEGLGQLFQQPSPRPAVPKPAQPLQTFKV